jgi:hypothetical protein
LTPLVPFYHSVNPSIDGSKNIWSFTPTRNTREIRSHKRRRTQKQILVKTCRESTESEMKFHFSVIGNAEADTESLLLVWLHDMVTDYNERSGSPIDGYQVIVGDETGK